MSELPRLDLTIGSLFSVTPEAFAKSSASGLFDCGGMYPGYVYGHHRFDRVQLWLREWRGWQVRTGTPSVPAMGYRPDLISYGERPAMWSHNWTPLRTKSGDIAHRLNVFLDAGWTVKVADSYLPWMPLLVPNRDMDWPVSYCKDQTGDPDRLLLQTACNDVRELSPDHAIHLAHSLGVGAIHLGCKRYMWSDLTRQFNPVDDRRGGPLVNPYAEGEFDHHMNRLIRAWINAGLVVVKQENPAGPGGRYDWLDRDLAESGCVFDTGAFVRVA